MSPTRSGYRELGLELVSLEENHLTTQEPPMEEEKRDEGAGDSINLFLEESLTRQRDEMMENFSQILRRLSTTTDTSSSSNHFGGITPFKVQVNFDIPVFEGQIDAECFGKVVKYARRLFLCPQFFQ
jgi:hypothetical protein